MSTKSPFGVKERLPFAEYVAVALVQAARQLGIGITNQPDELPGVIHAHFDATVGAEEISDAVDILSECGIAFVANDPVAGTFVRISDEKFDDFIKGVSADRSKYYKAVEAAGDDVFDISRAEDISTPYWDLIRKYSVIQKYSEFGSPFIEAAMKRIGQSDLNARLASGGDRIVSFADNVPVVEEIRAGLRQLEEQIKTNNEVGDALGDSKDEALVEVRALQSAMDGSQTRAEYLLSISRKVLSWIGRLVARTSAEEIVKHLTKLFIGWLS